MRITLNSFEGRWRIDRQIADARGTDAHFGGVAVFTVDSGGLLMEETGTLHTGGQSFAAMRRYRWQQDDQDIAVYFEDGRFFHRFDANGAGQARHWCDPDSYAVRYDFSRWPEWRSIWQVEGPRKSYTMTSRFSPDRG